MRSMLPFMLVCTLACRDDPSPPTDWDGDGLSVKNDCDDRRPEVGPNMPEVCDGLDNDCDGLIDEDDATDAPTWYLDYDGDGFGGPLSEVACVAPNGWLAVGGDCDDADARTAPGIAPLEAEGCHADADGDGWGDADPMDGVDGGLDCDDGDPDVHPGAPEVCDGADSDCDGELGADELDVDGDLVVACELVAVRAHVRGGDCNDALASVYPGAPERCDGADTDCNGLVDDVADAVLANEGVWWYRDFDGDGHGALPGASLACPAEARIGYADNADDCDDSRPTVYPAAPELCDGLDNGCDGVVDEDLSTCPAALDGEVTLLATPAGEAGPSCEATVVVTGTLQDLTCPDCAFVLELRHGAPLWTVDGGHCTEIDGPGTLVLGFWPAGGTDGEDVLVRVDTDGSWIPAYGATLDAGVLTWSATSTALRSAYDGGEVSYDLAGSGDLEY